MTEREDRDDMDQPNGASGSGEARGEAAGGYYARGDRDDERTDRGDERIDRGDADWFDGGWDTIRRDGTVPPDREPAGEADAADEAGPAGNTGADAAVHVWTDLPPGPGKASPGRPPQGGPATDEPPVSESSATGRPPAKPRAGEKAPGRRPPAGRVVGPGQAGSVEGGRRLRPAGYVFITLFIGFGLASLLLAPKLASLAKQEPFGVKRDVLVALTRPLTAISSLLRLDKPQAAVESALGRSKSQEQSGLASRPHASGTPTSSTTPGAGPTTGPPGGTTQPPGSWTPTRKDQLALWVGGDSMAMIFGQSLVALSQPTHVIDAVLDYKVSSGLSRPDFFNWPERLRAQMQSFDPHVAVAMFGANDGQSVEYQGKVLQFNTPAWLALYHRRVGQAMDILIGPRHRQVWWIGMPIMRSDAFSKVVRVLDSVYKAEAATRPDVHWVDTYGMFADKSGRYQDYLPGTSGKTELMRQSDGIHFSRAGADMAAKVVLDQIKALWHIK
jgi:uncharacterized protein